MTHQSIRSLSNSEHKHHPATAHSSQSTADKNQSRSTTHSRSTGDKHHSRSTNDKNQSRQGAADLVSIQLLNFVENTVSPCRTRFHMPRSSPLFLCRYAASVAPRWQSSKAGSTVSQPRRRPLVGRWLIASLPQSLLERSAAFRLPSFDFNSTAPSPIEQAFYEKLRWIAYRSPT